MQSEYKMKSFIMIRSNVVLKQDCAQQPFSDQLAQVFKAELQSLCGLAGKNLKIVLRQVQNYDVWSDYMQGQLQTSVKTMLQDSDSKKQMNRLKDVISRLQNLDLVIKPQVCLDQSSTMLTQVINLIQTAFNYLSQSQKLKMQSLQSTVQLCNLPKEQCSLQVNNFEDYCSSVSQSEDLQKKVWYLERRVQQLQEDLFKYKMLQEMNPHYSIY